MAGSVPVVLWFFAMEARSRFALPEKRWKFNLMQLGMVALSIIAIGSLFATIPESLLSTPDMQVTGNGSYNYFYNWYQDNSKELLPQGHIISVPIWGSSTFSAKAGSGSGGSWRHPRAPTPSRKA